MYGLAWKGGEGVTKALDILHQELLDCMSLSGFTDIRAIPEGTVTARPRL
jgi:isopentenyl diphosphate isomerase/L-lactate dehydrogenase-like FMN-dependent dehydrogenase